MFLLKKENKNLFFLLLIFVILISLFFILIEETFLILLCSLSFFLIFVFLVPDGIWIFLITLLFFSPLLPYKYHLNKFTEPHFGGASAHFAIDPVLVAFLVSLIIIFFFYRKKVLEGIKFSSIILIWIMFTLFSVAVSVATALNFPASVFEALKMLITAFICIFVYMIVDDKRKLKKVIIIISAVLILENFIAFLQEFGLLPLDLLVGGTEAPIKITNVAQIFRRATGTLREANTLGKFLSLYIPFFATLTLLTNAKKWKVLYFTVFTFSFLALLFTLGRAAIFGTLLGGVFSVYLIGVFAKEYLPSKKYIISGITVIIVLIITAISFLWEILYLRFVRFGFLAVDVRIDLLKNAFPIIKENFWFGVGLNNYTDYMIMNDFIGVAAIYPQFPVHNIYLLYLAEVGIFGFLLFLFFLFELYKVVFEYLRSARFDVTLTGIIIGGIGGITAILFQGVLGWGLRNYNIYSMFFLIGLVLSAIRIESRLKDER